MTVSSFPFVVVQSDCSPIDDAFVFGERNSGTNYVSELLRRNFDSISQMAGDRIDRFGFRYGWKHGFSTMVAAPATTLGVVVVRHPEYWLRSMFKRPWHSVPEIRKKSFSDFVRSEWISCVDEQNFGVLRGDSRWSTELQYDRHPLSEERFPNIIALRNIKTTSFLGYGNRFSNFCLVRLEDVQRDPSAFIECVSSVFKIVKNRDFSDVQERRGKNFEGDFSKTSYQALSVDDQKFVWGQLDRDQEAFLGYFPLSEEDKPDRQDDLSAGDEKMLAKESNAAIFFHPEAYTTTGPKLMGRNAAGESFLRGFLKHSNAKKFAVQVIDRTHAESFGKVAKILGRNEPVAVIDKSNLGSLRHHGIVYHPGPGIADHARQRSFWGHDAWSLCGITHTTSSARAMDSVAELVTAPVQPWDALICTSSAVKQNVQFLLEREAEYLAERLGASRTVMPKLPVIPLGIHTQDFEFGPKERIAARQALAIGDDALVVMFMGRLSFHAKAHPLPMYLALEESARRTGKSVMLVECGWHGNASIERAFNEGTAQLCPSVRSLTLDGRSAEERATAWAAADIFCSLSDNIQETFGISPIEAMAAGLPVVVSDWDGYKDTVRHDVDGFRVPTIMPRAGLGGDLALRHALEIDTYDMYIGHACSLAAVDVEATTAAFTALFESEELRRKMGAAGQARAREIYDWAKIILQYEDLWGELNEARKRASSEKKAASTGPARPDPFAAFASYPTQVLSEDTRLASTASDLETLCARVETIRSLAMVNFAKLVLPSPGEVQLVLAQAVKGPASALELVQDVAAERKAHVFRGLGWLLKIGALSLADTPQILIQDTDQT